MMLGETQHLLPLFCFVCAWSAVVGIVFERLLHAVVFFMASSVVAVGGGTGSLKRFASMEVLKEGILGVFDSVQSAFLAAATFMGTVSTSWFFIVSVLLVVFFAMCLQHESSELITSYIRIYNSDVSRTVRSMFLVSMQYGERFVQPVLYLWNSWCFLMKIIGREVFLPLLLESSVYVEKLATSLAMFASSIAVSIVTYVERLRQNDCSIDRILSSEQVRNGTLPCFVLGRRSLDLITPMDDLRLMVMYSVLILRNACAVLTPPFDLVAYPFLDINLAKAVHNFVNALLYWFVHMPIMTVQRCKAVTAASSANSTGGVSFEPWMKFLMCTPRRHAWLQLYDCGCTVLGTVA